MATIRGDGARLPATYGVTHLPLEAVADPDRNTTGDRRERVERYRMAEDLSFDTIAVIDHLGNPRHSQH
ncbi:hypothetical protein [Nonomuraea turcica]|uniref:hypothetical protein n=1 Tax=Nonomuraea sp. G32 TaxID=3067274 RepID=UPI00273A8905|nr:hypothetical protein [Nonomuraea sp. G32]MDP4511773.1 hypothetical protein [Nonomuraea sp. G32]